MLDDQPVPMASPAPEAPQPLEATSIASRPYAVAPAARRRTSGRWIILGAMLLATFIVLAGIVIAMQRRNQAEREQQLKDRFQRIQQLQSSQAEPPAD
jgi:flagellar biosynthesis/type III secretory pathway M-ring protein FliF/YscJ